MSGRIIQRLGVRDTKGNIWVAKVVLWPNKPAHANVTITFDTPNDPEHPFYGEDGPTFVLDDMQEVVSPARISRVASAQADQIEAALSGVVEPSHPLDRIEWAVMLRTLAPRPQ